MAKSKRKLTVFGKVLITMIGILFLVLCVLLSQLVIQLTKPEEKAPSEQEKVAQEETQEIEFSDREKTYADAHPELSEEEVIKRVAMNLDQEPYSNLQEVQDLDSDLQLVNKYYSLPSDYEPADLVPVSSSGENGTVMMRQKAAAAFEELVQASAQQGFILNACSAYRSYSYQEGLYNNGVVNYGQDYADAYWTRPGSSEHQTGLSVDIRMDNDLSDLDAVRSHPQYDWLLEHLADYGFILRYPDDKQDYTLIAPESWHLRYVGKEAAQEMADQNWCLEEYIFYKK